MHPALCSEHRIDVSLNTECFVWGTGWKLMPVILVKPWHLTHGTAVLADVIHILGFSCEDLRVLYKQ